MKQKTNEKKSTHYKKLPTYYRVNKDKQIQLIIAMTKNLEIFDMKKKHEGIPMSTQKEMIRFYCRDDRY